MKCAKCSSTIKGGKKLVTWLRKKAEVSFSFSHKLIRAFVRTIIGACWKQWLDADPERCECVGKRQAMCNDNRKRTSHPKKKNTGAFFFLFYLITQQMRSCTRTRHELLTETQLNWAILCGCMSQRRVFTAMYFVFPPSTHLCVHYHCLSHRLAFGY